MQVLPLLLARQLLEPPRRLLDFLRELPLRVAAAAAACWPGRRQPPLPLGFLLLPPRQLLQLLDQLVDLLVAALLLGALLHLVLVRQLVQLELEEVGEILGHLVLLPPPPPPPPRCCATCISYCCSASCSSFSARCSGDSASLAFWRLQVRPRPPSSRRGLRQRLGDRLERRIDDVEAAVHLAAQLLDLLAQLAPARA